MNITLSADEQIVERARAAAQRMGKSLNQAVRDYLEQLAGMRDEEKEIEAWRQRCLNSPAKFPKGWKFDREEANER